ncbi:hypothetical protein O0L34_g14146 [Tuta absoluta]|nr:hypothetical protein O0L34_g14146 [Tuta absoluta]
MISTAKFSEHNNTYENAPHIFNDYIYDSPNTTFHPPFNSENVTEYAEIPYYIKATSMTFCIAIMCLGVIGNVMVPIVILKTKDMRNSTNIFLVNLSIADLMVLLVCTPTVLVEVNSKPETWVLGKELCLAVPFIELTVAHASVLTILAISFERYYAICEPLRAGYVCTKTRATLICALAWFFAALFTSPILIIAEYQPVTRNDGTITFQCVTQAATFWQISFFVMIIILLYIIPLIILITLYTVIAKNLITAASKVVMNKTVDPYNARARRQVILMLGTVVLCFFLCLMPYRVLALWIIVTPQESTENITPETWYSLLYFSRIMLYINSAINPILYNLMSSKFRIGFCKICVCYERASIRIQKRAHRANTNGSTTSTSLTRTTNSLKKLFTHRSSLDKSDSELECNENKDDKRNGFFDRIFTNKRFVRQQSSPVCSNVKPKLNRVRSEGNLFEIIDIDKNIDNDIQVLNHSNSNRTDIEIDRGRGSLRRSALMNAQTKSIESDRKKMSYQKLNVEPNIIKSKSDFDFPESFV